MNTIIICEYGWIICGVKASENTKAITLKDASVVRRWSSGRGIGALAKKEYKDEKSVKNALSEMKAGDFEIYLPGEEGYEDSMVEIKNYQEPKEEPVFVKSMQKFDDEIEEEEETSTEELMGATNVYEESDGFSVEDAE